MQLDEEHARKPMVNAIQRTGCHRSNSWMQTRWLHGYLSWGSNATDVIMEKDQYRTYTENRIHREAIPLRQGP